ncbi:MAG: hypothetical protein IJT94_18695 [Oscillibacter sp.]|nr:hypothetical protein [Oscillibacter sp.]
MDNVVERREFEEYKQRLEDQKARWDKRLEILENNAQQIHALTTSVEKLALSMERMTKEQTEQNERLKAIESRDGEMWRKVIGYVLTALASAVMTFIFTRIGH